jgi:hypothetical protein
MIFLSTDYVFITVFEGVKDRNHTILRQTAIMQMNDIRKRSQHDMIIAKINFIFLNILFDQPCSRLLIYHRGVVVVVVVDSRYGKDDCWHRSANSNNTGFVGHQPFGQSTLLCHLFAQKLTGP